MKCSFCGRPDPSVRLRKEANGEHEDYRLCQSCAETLGYDTARRTSRPSVNTLFAGVFDPVFERDDEDRCPECSQTLRRIRQTGRVGCPHCYIVFQGAIADLLKRYGAETHHTGGHPRRLARYRDFFVRRESLRDKLDEALDQEDYEEAARLRDDLLSLQQEGADGEGLEEDGKQQPHDVPDRDEGPGRDEASGRDDAHE